MLFTLNTVGNSLCLVYFGWLCVNMPHTERDWPVVDFGVWSVGSDHVLSDQQLKPIADDVLKGLKEEGFVILKNTGIRTHPKVTLSILFLW